MCMHLKLSTPKIVIFLFALLDRSPLLFYFRKTYCVNVELVLGFISVVNNNNNDN